MWAFFRFARGSRFPSFCTLSVRGHEVFLSSDLAYKVKKTDEAVRLWLAGSLPVGHVPLSNLPLYPGRPAKPDVVDIVPSFQELKVPKIVDSSR